MKLSELIAGLPAEDRGAGEREITNLTCDTRTLRPGGLFAALPGWREDGNDYIRAALDKGAAAVLCQRAPAEAGPWLVTAEPRRTYGLLCRRWFGDPAAGMTLIGVTGTNGKTTTTYLLKIKP